MIHLRLGILTWMLWMSTAMNLMAQLPKSPGSPSGDSERQMAFHDAPMDLYTGVPDIYIPIHEIQGTDLAVPIRLVYHPNGLKVAEESSSIGLGWTLQAGGLIARTLHGLPDEKPGTGYLSLEGMIPESGTEIPYAMKRFCAEGMMDLEPDVFTVTAPGLNCRIIFDKDESNSTMSPVVIPSQHLIIKEGYGANGLKSWVITNTEGVKYYFGQLPNQWEAIETTTMIGNQIGGLTYTSAWYLLKMVSPGHTDSIEFHYDTPQVTTRRAQSSVRSFALNGCQSISHYDSPISTSIGRHLTRIEWPFGTVMFKYIHSRQDIESSQNMLDSIIVLCHDGSLLSSYTCYHSYFQSWGCSSSSPENCLRLRLDSIRQGDAHGNTIPAWRLNYHQGELPPKDSKAIDHWGCYNGATQNTTLIPTIQDGPIQFSGANRDPNPATMNYCSLSKIINPMGGVNAYYWEAHDYGFSGSSPVNSLVLKPQALTKIIQGNLTSIIPDSFEFPFLLSHGQNVDLLHQCSNLQNLTIESYAEIIDQLGQVLKTIVPSTVDLPFYLSAGQMKLRMIIFPHETFQVSLSWSNYQIQEDSSITTTDIPAGGLRIARIISDDGVSGPFEQSFDYRMENGRSSGVLLAGNPVYQYISYSPIITQSNPIGSLPIVSGVCSYLNVFSSDRIQSSSIAENNVVYRRVTQSFGSNGEFGSIVSKYSFKSEERSGFYPFPPTSGNSYQRGYVLERRVMNAQGHPRKIERYKYSHVPVMDNNTPKVIHGLKIGWLEKSIGPAYDRFQEAHYSYNLGHMQLDTAIEEDYDINGNLITRNINAYFYQPSRHQKPSQIRSQFADGSQETRHFIYTEDLITQPFAAANTALLHSRDTMARGFINNLEEECVSPNSYLDTAQLLDLDAIMLQQSSQFSFFIDSLNSREGPPPLSMTMGTSAQAASVLVANNQLGMVWLDAVMVPSSSGQTMKTSNIYDYILVGDRLVKLKNHCVLNEHPSTASMLSLNFDSSANLLLNHEYRQVYKISEFDSQGRPLMLEEPDGRINISLYSSCSVEPVLRMSGVPGFYAACDFNGLYRNVELAPSSISLPNLGWDSAYQCSPIPITAVELPAGYYRMVFRTKTISSPISVAVGYTSVVCHKIGMDKQDWEWMEARFSVSQTSDLSISGYCLIDDLVIIPRDNSFEYKKYNPQGLMILEIADGKQGFEYEYDGFGRVIRARDMEGRTRAEWEYKIAGR